LANQWRGENDTPATPADFMPWLPEDDDDEKPTDMVAMIEHLNMVFGGDDLRVPRDPDLAAAIAEGALELIEPLRQAEQDYPYPWEP